MTTHPRLLDVEVEVNDDDNIKQDLSIDVYGRDKGEEGDGEDDKLNAEIDRLANI